MKRGNLLNLLRGNASMIGRKKCRSNHQLTVLTFLSLAFLGSHLHAQERLPSSAIVVSEVSTPADWIPLERAIDNQGRLKPSLFAPGSTNQIEHLWLRPAPLDSSMRVSCDEVTHRSESSKSVVRDLSSVIAEAPSTYFGTIERVTPGFLRSGDAGVLLQVRPDKAQAGTAPPRTLLVFYPSVAATVDHAALCKNEVGFTLKPVVGDRVALLPHEPPIDAQSALYSPAASELILISPRDGALVFPQALQTRNSEQVRTVDDLRTLVRTIPKRSSPDGSKANWHEFPQ
jgi:hypothetical protein